MTTDYQRLRAISDALERDRHEPDKVLCYVADMRRLSDDMDAAREPLRRALRDAPHDRAVMPGLDR